MSLTDAAATKVKKPEVMTFWWEKVLQYEPTHEIALAELYKLYERNQEWDKLADSALHYTEAHHVVDYQYTQKTSVDNGVLLTRWDHRTKLSKGWNIEIEHGLPHWKHGPPKTE